MRGLITSTPRWAWLWIAFFLLAGCVPVLTGVFATPAGKTFTGVLYNPTDLNSYLADMELGREGSWLYVLPYTAPRSTPIPLFMVYIALGHAARLTGFSLPLVFHLARIASAGLFAFTAYHFIARFLPDTAERRLAFGLLLFTGGLSGVIVTAFVLAASLGADVNLSLDFIPDYAMTEAVSFASMLHNVHFTLSMVCMMVLLLAGEAYFQQGRRSALAPALLVGLGLALIHAHQLAVVGLVAGIGWLLRSRAAHRPLWGEAARIAVVFVPVSLIAGAMTLQSWTDDLLSSWLAQGNTLTPPVWAITLILYGPLFWMAVAGSARAVRQREEALYPAVLWFVVVFVLIYVPVNFQRRFLEGWQIPVVILAAIGWRRRVRPWLADRLRPRALRTVTVVTTICLILTPLFLVAEGLASVFSANRPFTYLDRDTSRAIDWLRANTETGETVVFTGYEIGNVLPAWVPVRTTLGHWSLTTHIDDRRDDFERFYDAATPDAERIAILRDLGVDYVYAGAEEREAGDFAPDVAPYLAPVFSSETASIYRFESE